MERRMEQKLARQESSEALIVCGWWAQMNSIIYLFILSCALLLLLLTDCIAPKHFSIVLLNDLCLFPSDIPLETQKSIFLLSIADKLSVLLVWPPLLFKFRQFPSVADQNHNRRCQRWMIQAEYVNVKFYKVKGVSTVFLTNLVKLQASN